MCNTFTVIAALYTRNMIFTKILYIARYRALFSQSHSKVFEKKHVWSVYEYIGHFLNQLLCGFRKAYSTQHALFRLLEKWQKELDSGWVISTILMDLSKAYDCLPHDLLKAKLEAYGLDNGSLNLLLDYISLRKLRTKVGFAYSKW